jgi:DMSO/TMAO reductase YedYZ heme-binding membrane subunit
MRTPRQFRRAGQEVTIVSLAVFLFFVILHYLRRLGNPIAEIAFPILFNSVALTSVILIGLSFLIGPLARFWPETWIPRLPLRKHYGVLGFFLAAIHVLWALAIMTPAQYPDLYEQSGELSATGNLSMLFGIVSFVILAGISVTSLPSMEERMSRRAWLLAQRTGYIALLAATAHFSVIKWRGWLDPAHWTYYLPPGTFVAFVFVAFVFVLRLLVLFFPLREPGE